MEFLNKYKIDQVYISNQINNKSKYFLNYKYENKLDSTLFIGIFNSEDIYNLKNHLGKRYILWVNNECNPYLESKRKNMKYILNNIKIVIYYFIIYIEYI